MYTLKSEKHTTFGNSRRLLLLVLVVHSICGCSRVVKTDSPEAVERPCFLVNLNCDPLDSATLERVLNTAISLSAAKAEVVLFLDLDAVILGSTFDGAPHAERLNEFFSQFAKNEGSTLLCPHCYEQQGLDIRQVRPGIRMTNKEELDAIRQRADMVLFGSESDLDSGPVAVHGPSAGTRLSHFPFHNLQRESYLPRSF
ncbi:MAG: hypothetical protein U0795_04545 [Pirellulales bacterium]